MADWTPVTEAMPKPGVTVLAFYKNRCNNGRRIRAVWVPAKFEEASPEQDFADYDEATDTYYSPEGWYEQIDNWDDYTAVAVHEGEVSHWMPMPEPPTAGVTLPTTIEALAMLRRDIERLPKSPGKDHALRHLVEVERAVARGVPPSDGEPLCTDKDQP